ncbi:MAG: hypothetical protein ACE5EU_10485, partial [Paracoccaceae bacterium]
AGAALTHSLSRILYQKRPCVTQSFRLEFLTGDEENPGIFGMPGGVAIAKIAPAGRGRYVSATDRSAKRGRA